MAQLFGDPAGLGGGGGAVTAAGRTGSGSTKVILGSARVGSYDVLGVCTGSGIMRLTVVETDPTKTGSGRDTVLAVSDIACGATLRLPVTVSKSEVSLAVSQNTGAAQWWASIVSPGWEPSPTSYSR